MHECNQLSAGILEQPAFGPFGNERLIRLMIHGEDAESDSGRKKKLDDLDGTLESPGRRVSWRSIASVSGQTP